MFVSYKNTNQLASAPVRVSSGVNLVSLLIDLGTLKAHFGIIKKNIKPPDKSCKAISKASHFNIICNFLVVQLTFSLCYNEKSTREKEI